MPPPPPQRRGGSPAPPNVGAEAAESVPTRAGLGAESIDPRIATAQGLIESLRAQLERTRDSLRQGRLHYEIARLLESPIADLPEATKHYEQAYQRAPDHVPTLRGMRRLIMRAGNDKSVLALFDAEIRYTGAAEGKAELYYQKGRFLEDVSDDTEGAREAFSAAVDLDSSNVTFLRALARLESTADHWQALDRLLEDEANAVSDDVQLRAALIAETGTPCGAKK